MRIEPEIRAEMARQGITGAELSASLGIKRPYLSLRLNGHFDFKAGEIIDICEVLGVPASEIFRRAEASAQSTPDAMSPSAAASAEEVE